MRVGQNRAQMLGILAIAVLVPLAALLFDYADAEICGRLVLMQEAFNMRVGALASWAVSLGLVGYAVWRVRLCGYSALDRRILWGVFGMWKLMSLGFALSVGVPCWDSSGLPFSNTGSSWEAPAMMLTLAMWAVFLFCLLVLIVVGPRDEQ